MGKGLIDLIDADHLNTPQLPGQFTAVFPGDEHLFDPYLAGSINLFGDSSHTPHMPLNGELTCYCHILAQGNALNGAVNGEENSSPGGWPLYPAPSDDVDMDIKVGCIPARDMPVDSKGIEHRVFCHRTCGIIEANCSPPLFDRGKGNGLDFDNGSLKTCNRQPKYAANLTFGLRMCCHIRCQSAHLENLL